MQQNYNHVISASHVERTRSLRTPVLSRWSLSENHHKKAELISRKRPKDVGYRSCRLQPINRFNSNSRHVLISSLFCKSGWQNFMGLLISNQRQASVEKTLKSQHRSASTLKRVHAYQTIGVAFVVIYPFIWLMHWKVRWWDWNKYNR